MSDFSVEISKLPKNLILLGGLCLVFFLGVTDYITGSELSFSIFFLAPISFVTLLTKRTYGWLLSFISACTWLTADLAAGHKYGHTLIPFWNAATRFGYFFLHTYLLDSMCHAVHMAKELALIDSLTGALNSRCFSDSSWKE